MTENSDDRRQMTEDRKGYGENSSSVLRLPSSVCFGQAKRSRILRHSGIVLLVTMVVLIVLAILGYNIASRVAAQRHRDNYIIDYTSACYARDSAIKYALVALQDFNSITLVDRPNEPDFSDLFSLTEEQYHKLIEQWAQQLAKDLAEKAALAGENPATDENSILSDIISPVKKSKSVKDINLAKLFNSDQTGDINDINDINEPNGEEPNTGEPNLLEQAKIRGPYGPQWPLVTEPMELEIGKTKVKIEIEDENAKFPMGWAILSDDNLKRESDASLKTFCEWMKMGPDEVAALQAQLGQVATIKTFTVDLKEVTQKTPVVPPGTPPTRRRGTRPQQQTAFKTTVISQTEAMTKQAKDFSKLFHSSIIDTEMLARPTVESEERKESALKYISLWGTTQVNINSATRQVLESALVFGGNARDIADAIIKQRKQTPITNLDELKKNIFGYSASIDKCKPYITTTSNIFSIHVTATSGVAKASAVIVVLRNNGKLEKIAVICG